MWPACRPSSTSCTEYATSSDQSMTWASKHGAGAGGALADPVEDRAGRPRRPRTSGEPGSVGWAPRGQGYLVAASRAARVRLRPTLTVPCRRATNRLGSMRVSSRSDWALPSKPPQSVGELVERLFAVVPEGRVAQVVGEAGGLDEVGVAAEGRAQLPADLGALQGVGQPGAGAGVPGGLRRAGRDDLGLAGEPAQRGGVQHAGAVALEGGAAGAFVGLGGPARGGRVVVVAERVVGIACRCSRCPWCLP